MKVQNLVISFFLVIQTLGFFVAQAATRADFAIYDPQLAFEADGVWKPEVAVLQKMLEFYQWSYEIVGFKEINSQGLIGADGKLSYKGLIMPGGYSAARRNQLNATGQKNIEQFIQAGGNYVGFCAGSYFASQNMDWAEESSDAAGISNLAQDYTAYFNLQGPNLLPGRAIGPLGWAPWKVKGKYTAATGLSSVKIDTQLDVMKRIGMPENTMLFYYGGPFFEIPAGREPQGYKVWARAVKPKNISGSDLGDGKPTIFEFNLAQGKVILFSYHPVILLAGKINGVQMHRPLEMPVVNSNPAPYTLDQVNYQSWNILHAALSEVSGREIVPMPVPK